MSRMRSREDISKAAQVLSRDTAATFERCWNLIYMTKLKWAGEASKLVFDAFVDLADHWPLAIVLRLYERFVRLRNEATSEFPEDQLGSTAVDWSDQYLAREAIGEASWLLTALCKAESRYFLSSRSAVKGRNNELLLTWEPGGDGERCCIEAHILYVFLTEMCQMPGRLALRYDAGSLALRDRIRLSMLKAFEGSRHGLPKDLLSRYRGSYSRAKGFSVEGVVSSALSYYGEIFASDLAAIWDIFLVTRHEGPSRSVIAIQVKAGSPVISTNTLQEMKDFVRSRFGLGVLISLRDDNPSAGELRFDVWNVSELNELFKEKITNSGRLTVPQRNESEAENILRVSFDCRFGAFVRDLGPLWRSAEKMKTQGDRL